MKVITGKVVDGRIELPAGEFAEGELVAVVGSGEPVELSPEDESELLDRLEAVRRGEFISEEDFLKQLRGQRRA